MLRIDLAKSEVKGASQIFCTPKKVTKKFGFLVGEKTSFQVFTFVNQTKDNRVTLTRSVYFIRAYMGPLPRFPVLIDEILDLYGIFFSQGLKPAPGANM